MTATALPPTASGETVTPITPTTAGPGVTAAPNATASTPAAAPASLIAAAEAASYDLKAEGMHADDLKAFCDVLGEHKVDGKIGQAILDKMLPALGARREAAVKAQWEATQKGWREENAKNPDLDPSKPENAARAKLALDIAGSDVLAEIKAKGLSDLPAFNLLASRIGAYLQKVTKQDTAVPGTTAAAPQGRAPNDISAAAFAEAYRN